MSKPDASQVRRSRIQLVLIFALFLLPPVSAWVAWKYLGEQGVGATTNAGSLISPARPLSPLGLAGSGGMPMDDGELRGRWTYVMFAPSDCAERCQQQLYITRQVRLAMSKDIPRVQRLLVLDQAPPATLVQQLGSDHADLHWGVRGERSTTPLREFSGDGFAADGAHFFLVDPLGNLMMHYSLDVPAKGMIRDLQKLLKISQVG